MNDRYDDYKKYWPGVNIVGKEMPVPLHHLAGHADEPRRAPAQEGLRHGWLLLDGGKIQVQGTCRPLPSGRSLGVDALRFFLLRTFPFGSEALSNELLINCITRLGQRPGNIVSAPPLVQKYFGGTCPRPRSRRAMTPPDRSGDRPAQQGETEMERFQPQNAIAEIFKVLPGNKYTTGICPGCWARTRRRSPALQGTLQSARVHPHLRRPATPSCRHRRGHMGRLARDSRLGPLSASVFCPPQPRHCRRSPVPRIDVDRTGRAGGPEPGRQGPRRIPCPSRWLQIDFDTFSKVEMTVVKVLEWRGVKKSEKLEVPVDDAPAAPADPLRHRK